MTKRSKARFDTSAGTRSGFEFEVEKELLAEKIQIKGYEVDKLFYTIPERKAAYIPDYTLKSGVFLEIKGRFTPTDRTKLLRVKRENPSADIRLVFQRDNWLTKKKKSRYSDWAAKHGFPYSIFPELPL